MKLKTKKQPIMLFIPDGCRISKLLHPYGTHAVITGLENTTARGKDKVRIWSGPSAAGLVKKLKKPSTVRVVHFLCDALKPVTQLALIFEKNDVELTNIHARLQSTILTLGRPKEKDGVNTVRSEKLLGLPGKKTDRMKSEIVREKIH